MRTKCNPVRRSITSVPAPAPRVLVVDDHRQARESMTDMLRHAGHQVECLSSAARGARTWLSTESFDVVITDLQMPGMSGLEFIRHLRSAAARAQMLMVTAHATVASAVEAMRHGAFDYIEKPFDADQLEQLVARCWSTAMLDRPAARRSAAAGHSRRR